MKTIKIGYLQERALNRNRNLIDELLEMVVEQIIDQFDNGSSTNLNEFGTNLQNSLEILKQTALHRVLFNNLKSFFWEFSLIFFHICICLFFSLIVKSPVIIKYRTAFVISSSCN